MKASSNPTSPHQVHDELILEGPEESVHEALSHVIADMSTPFDRPLLVDLAVDADHAATWLEAK
jgi:DNA polymerase-1